MGYTEGQAMWLEGLRSAAHALEQETRSGARGRVLTKAGEALLWLCEHSQEALVAMCTESSDEADHDEAYDTKELQRSWTKARESIIDVLSKFLRKNNVPYRAMRKARIALVALEATAPEGRLLHRAMRSHGRRFKALFGDAEDRTLILGHLGLFSDEELFDEITGAEARVKVRTLRLEVKSGTVEVNDERIAKLTPAAFRDLLSLARAKKMARAGTPGTVEMGRRLLERLRKQLEAHCKGLAMAMISPVQLRGVALTLKANQIEIA